MATRPGIRLSMGLVACLRSPVPAELLSAGWGCMQHVATGGTAHAHFITHAHVMNSWFKFRQCPSGQAFNTLGAAPAGPLAPFGVQLFCAQEVVHECCSCIPWVQRMAAHIRGTQAWAFVHACGGGWGDSVCGCTCCLHGIAMCALG